MRHSVGDNLDLTVPFSCPNDGSDSPACCQSDGSSLLDSNQPKELNLHLTKCFWMPVLEISKGLPKAKGSRAAEGTKDDRERIELTIASEVMERQPSNRNTPAVTL